MDESKNSDHINQKSDYLNYNYNKFNKKILITFSTKILIKATRFFFQFVIFHDVIFMRDNYK